MSVEVVTALCHPPSHRGQFSPPHWGHPHSLHLGSPGSEGENHSGHLCLAGVPMAASKSTWGDTPLACVKPQPAEGPPLLPAPTQSMADAAGAGAESALQSVPPPILLLERQKASEKHISSSSCTDSWLGAQLLFFARKMSNKLLHVFQ